MRNKKRINTTFDDVLWDLLQIKYGHRRVEVLEDLARIKLFGEKTIEEFEQEIKEREDELQTMKDELKEMKRARDINDSNQELINKSMGIIRRIIFNQGHIIGENQIMGVSRMQGISYHILKKETEKIEDIQIVPAYDPPKN